GWVWSIVRSELARHFRDRRIAEPLDQAGGALSDAAPRPPEVAERNEAHARMRRALERLTEEQQKIVYMKFFQDMPNVEIAEALGLSVSNVGVIVHRAMKRLRELLGPEAQAAAPDVPKARGTGAPPI